MATLTDVQNAIDGFNAAVAAEQQAVTALTATEAVVTGSLTTETATFSAAQQAYDAALTAARDAAGFPAALAARDAATLAREQSESDMRQTLSEFIAS